MQDERPGNVAPEDMGRERITVKMVNHAVDEAMELLKFTDHRARTEGAKIMAGAAIATALLDVAAAIRETRR